MMRAKLSTCVLLLVTACHLHAAGLPASGMSMRAVEQEFGAPLKKNAAIGHPPITRWEYDGFVVVFERSTVVQSVEISGQSRVPAAATRFVPAQPPVAPAQAPAPAVAPNVVPAQSGMDEIERQAREHDAMAKAAAEKAEAAPKPAATPAPVINPAPVAPVVAAPEPVAPTPTAAPATAAPVNVTPAVPAAPEPAPAPEPKKPKGDGSYTFDPATGRIIIN